VHDYEIRPEDRFLCAVGDPEARLKYAGIIEERGGSFSTLIMPSALVGDRTIIKPGTILCENVELTTDIRIGKHACVMSNCVIGHNVQIGDGTMISAFSFLGGHAKVGQACFLGPHAVILPKARVGDGCRVGAASVVLRSAPAHTTVFGNPAGVIARHEGS
jgi:sugar O-acyltransferase (sialic acid O-acetyltransferase NeuD family)